MLSTLVPQTGFAVPIWHEYIHWKNSAGLEGELAVDYREVQRLKRHFPDLEDGPVWIELGWKAPENPQNLILRQILPRLEKINAKRGPLMLILGVEVPK
jgi:hypothetical protein